MKGNFKFQDDYIYKMPVHFGGSPYYPWSVVHRDVLCILVQYETDPEALVQYLPEIFELREPLLSIQFSNCKEVEWMSNAEYRLIQISIPVLYKGKSEEISGEYALVVWENKTCPIIGGREEDGVPKIFADIAHERHVGDYWFTGASYESCTFLQINVNKKNESLPEDIKKMNLNSKINLFGWRYLPNLGKGGAALSHATLYPQEMEVKQAWYAEGNVKWTKLSAEQHPLQHHIIKALADLPVIRYTNAMISKGLVKLNVGDSKILL
jgi:acetoacetate decarboxylase